MDTERRRSRRGGVRLLACASGPRSCESLLQEAAVANSPALNKRISRPDQSSPPQALALGKLARAVCTHTAVTEVMATEEPGGSGEADLNAVSEGLGANPSSAGSGDRSLQDACATAPVDSEVGGNGDTFRCRKISVSVHGVCV